MLLALDPKNNVDGSIAYRRLRAPRETGGTLIEPPLAAVVVVVKKNIERLSADVDLQGRSLGDLMRLAREELIRAARRYTSSYRAVSEMVADGPLFLAGHQPQIFHPGVWYKNFVLGELARRQGGVAVNLVIDSDTIKTATLAVPGGSPSDPVVEMLPLDALTAEIPFEQRAIVDRERFESFGQRVAQRIAPLVPNPLVREYWPLVVARARDNANLGECLAQARHQLEGQWGLTTLEVPQSHVCGFESFHWFTAHLLAHLPRLREIYNAGVAEYRRANHIRSAAHPVPNLAIEGDWLEAPFWIWQDDEPRRRRLFVRRRNGDLLLSDRASIEFSLPLEPDGDPRSAVEQLASLRGRGIKLRTRALITTLFARLLLGDLFLHGIGGAKYDQLTDSLIARFFGLTPPEFMVVSATMRLPIAREADPAAELQRVERSLRDLEYNPQRFLDGDMALATEKQRWVTMVPTPGETKRRTQEIRRLNEALQPSVSNLRQQLLERREQLIAAARADRVLASRDYGFCLYPKQNLLELLLAFQEDGA